MSCSKCNDLPIRGAFFRWKNADVEIVACEKHWLEITNVLKNHLREFETPEEEQYIF